MANTPVGKVIRQRHYGWVIFCLVFCNLIVEGGMRNSASVTFLALRNGFGRSAGATAGIFSTVGLTSIIFSPLLGGLLDRLGARILFPLGGLFILLGYLLSSVVTDFWQLFIFYGVFAAIGETMVSSFTATANLAPWFPRSRGRALGLADAGNPLGQAIFAPLTQAMIVSIGWRGAFRVIGPVFFLLVAPANYLLQRAAPSGAGSQGAGEAVESQPGLGPRPAAANRRRQARMTGRPSLRPVLRSIPFWCLVSARTFAALGNQLTTLHMVAFFVASGYTPFQAASTIGVVGLVSLGARPVTGALSDYLGRELVYTAGLSMQVAGVLTVLVFGSGTSLWPLALFVGLTGLSDGIAGLVLGAKAADLFPSSTLGSVMGIVQSGRGLGIMVGPVLGGLLFDLKGDYSLAFSLAVFLSLAAISFMWAARFTAVKAS